MAENEEKEQQLQNVTLSFRVNPDIPTVYANEMSVQSIHSNFILSLFELKLPIGKPPTELVADCVLRAAIPVEKIPDFIATLQKHYESYQNDRVTIELVKAEKDKKKK